MEQTNVWAKRAHSRDTRDSGDMKSESIWKEPNNFAMLEGACGC